MHGRVEGATDCCAFPGCDQVGEYKAPVQPANFNGPGSWRLLCLDHVREHNSKYNFFNGMSPDEIAEAQTPYAGWERSTRVFTGEGAVRRRPGVNSPIRSTRSQRGSARAAKRRRIRAFHWPNAAR